MHNENTYYARIEELERAIERILECFDFSGAYNPVLPDALVMMPDSLLEEQDVEISDALDNALMNAQETLLSEIVDDE